jgi:ribonucleoside-diphosphate reductase alpha chain
MTTAIEERGAETKTEPAPPARIELPEPTLRYFDGDELRARVFYEKYALRDERGHVVEETPPEMWRRVARELASVEQSEELRKEWTEKFYWLLGDFRFIPGGRILFGAGQSRRSTLLNCYYLPVKGDSIEAIFDFCREAARTYSFGGGVGTDISVLRPRGAPVNNSAVVSTGSVSFMELMSVTTGTIGQSGRRGALIITIRVDHPDVLDFVHVKRDLRKVTYANVSVTITDAFMEAVESDAEFELWFENEKANVHRKVRARDVWAQLIRAAWESAEPGLIFWDQVKRESPTEYNGMEVHGFNPCSEQCLEDYGCCCLGNVNLTTFVKNDFTPAAAVDWDQLDRALRYTVRFLDNVLDYNADRHPLPAQKDASLRSRRIGVGFTGLADMLIKLGLKYDDESTVGFIDQLFERIKNITYEASSDIAAEKGSFPGLNLDKHLQRPFLRRIQPAVQEKIRRQGLRNACLLTVPPVGSGSVLAGTTSGVEPIFALSYLRRSKSLSQEEFRVYHPLVRAYMEREGLRSEEQLPNFFVVAHKIRPELRVLVQATIQKHIDSSISSTVNLAQDAPVENVGEIYLLAWKLGCKGITVYREGSREGILVTDAAAKPAPAPTPAPRPVQFERPKVLEGKTVKMKLYDGSLYVTANFTDGLKEVFVNLGKSGGDRKADAEAMGRLISLYLQKGGDLREVIHTLKGIQGEHVVWSDGHALLSVPDAVAQALELLVQPQPGPIRPTDRAERCPHCGEPTLISENGCFHCRTCGYDKCN